MWGEAVIVQLWTRRVLVLGTVLVTLLLALPPRALALDPDRRISQYAHTAWRVRDGAFAGAPSSITQTTDGYLWIGTLAGLLRFDGVRFVPFVPPAGTQLPNPAIFSLLGATDGSLWIGTASGLAQWKNGELFTFPETAGRVNSIYEDRNGTIWIARSRTEAGGVCRVTASVATCYAPKDGVPPNAQVLTQDNLGFFLIGHSTGIVRWKPGSFISHELASLKSNRGLAGISDLAVAPDGLVWAGLWNPGQGLGLKQLVNGSWKTFITPAIDTGRWGVNNLRLDRHSALWIATDGNGIYRVHDGNVDHFASAQGLSSDSVEYAFEDREGNLWLATARGVDCLRNIPVVSFSVQEGLSAGDSVASILAAHDGTVWIGNHGQLDFVRRNVISSIGARQGLHGNRVTSLFEDHAGQLWVGIDNGLLVYSHGRFTPVHHPDGKPVGIVLAMTEDIDHNVWASAIRNPPGRPTKLICFREGRFVKEISDRGLDVVSLAADPKSGLWLGLLQGGLARYRNDQVQVFPFSDATARVNQVLTNVDGSVLAATNHGLVERRGDAQYKVAGLPCNQIFALVADNYSDLWLYAECGLIEIKSDDLQQWRKHPDVKVKFDLFDAFDGAQPFLPPFRPIATRSNDGRLWFANDTVAQRIDPDGPLRNLIPPPVHIEDLIADRKTYPSQGRLHLPALTRDLEIDYTALSFVVPQKVHFQYKLEGYDRDWQDVGSRRQAFYTNLPPRHYTFQVRACNNSGVWNEAGDSVDFVVAPAFYQTVWFRSLGVFLFLAVLAGFYRVRLRHLERQRDALRKSEKELRDVIDTIPALVWSALPDGSNTYVNKRFAEYTGSSAEQVAGSGWQALVHPDDLERHAGKWMEAVAAGKPHESEVRSLRSDGQYRWQLDRGVPLRDEDGNIVRWYGVTTDIEDRKRAEEALQLMSRDLQESKAKLEEAQRITHVGYWEWDIVTGRVHWSDETYRIYGMRPQERPMDIAACQEKIHPEDWQRGMESALGGARFNAECRVFRPTGEERIAHFQGDVKRDASGQPYRMFGTIQDITDRKRAEQRLRESEAYLAEAQRLSQTGSWAWNPATGDIRYWSEMCYSVLGFDPAGPLPRFEEFLHRIHPDDQAPTRERFEKAIRDKADFELDYRVVHPEKGIRDIHVVGHAVLDGCGNLGELVGTVIDVTERKSAEEALQQSQFYLTEGQRLARMGSWVLDSAGCFPYWSHELFHIYGLDPAKQGPNLEEYLALIHPQDREFMRSLIKKMVAETLGCDVIKRIVRPNGELRYIRCVGIPVVEDGTLQRIVGTAMDVTEHELLTRELRRREAYLAEAQRLSHTGSFGWKPDSGEIVWSDETYRIFGYDPAVKPTIDSVVQRVHPEDRPDFLKVVESASAGATQFEHTYRWLLPDGSVKHVHALAHALHDVSGNREFVGAATDVTSIKRAEEELRKSEAYLAEAQRLTHTGSGAWRVAGDEALYLSEEWFRIYGFDPKQGLSAWKGRLQRVHPEDRAKVRAAKERAIREKSDYEVEYRIVLPDGTLKYNHTLGHPVLNASGDVEEFVCTWMDITERKRAEQELEKLRQLEADLAHVNRVSMLGEMAASLAHEIKQPITAAITSANSCIRWLGQEPPNIERARAAATRVDKDGTRAAHIIDRLRSLYKKSPPQREWVDVNEVIHEMLALLLGETHRHSIAISTELAAELPKIMADRVQLQQVFMNLMLNAVEAMEDSGGDLTVKSEVDGGMQLVFSVSDTGVGLPTEEIDQIFSAFFTTKPQGSGMGLAISRSIVESHGGRLWATANSGQGATFHFTLPTEVT